MVAEKSTDLLDPDALLRRPGARLLVLAPHPDDESLAAGGLIQRARAHGADVSVVFVSDGENNPWPQRALERRAWIGPRQRAALGARRRGEADAALRVLGVEPWQVRRLGWPDGGITGMLLEHTSEMLVSVCDLLEQQRPSLLALPDIADSHPDHSALHLLLEMALRAATHVREPDCLGYVLHGRSRPDVSQRAVLQLTDAEVARKRAAIEAHASQIAFSRRRFLKFAAAEETFVAGLTDQTGNGVRLPWLPPRALRPALALLVVDATGGCRVHLGGGAGTNLFWRDGSPAACLPRVPAAPYYAKLYCTLPSPWVFDGWGWCRLGAARA